MATTAPLRSPWALPATIGVLVGTLLFLVGLIGLQSSNPKPHQRVAVQSISTGSLGLTRQGSGGQTPKHNPGPVFRAQNELERRATRTTSDAEFLAGATTVDAARAILGATLVAVPLMSAGLPKEQTAEMVVRQRHVLNELVFLNVSGRFITGRTSGDSGMYLPDILFQGIKACSHASFETRYCVLFQDDTVFHPQFHLHAARLIRELPSNWIAAHICPEPLARTMPGHPRKYKGPPVVGRNPDFFRPLDPAFLNKTIGGNGTFFARWPQFRWGGEVHNAVPGRPVAFLLKRHRALDLLRNLKLPSPKGVRPSGNDDYRLAFGVATRDAYIARDPQLCYHMRSGTTVDTRFSVKEKVPYPYNP